MAQLSETFDLRNDFDVVIARQRAREISRNLGFGLTDQTRIATAVSEVARRALANQGSISLGVVNEGNRRGIECICRGYDPPATDTPSGRPLCGLQGVERLMDEFVWKSDQERIVVMRKWLREPLRPGAGKVQR